MSQFHQLTVSDVRRETPDAVSIAFAIPANLKEEFNYLPGQYITVKLDIDGEEIRRSYSLCSSPVADDEYRIAVKQVHNGRASTYLNQKLQNGTQLEVMPPEGRFHPELDAGNKKHYVGFAGGSGITPVISIIKSVLKEEAGSQATLFYSNNDDAAIIFKDELQQLVQASGGRFSVHFINSKAKSGKSGLKKLFGKKDTADLLMGRLDAKKAKGLVAQVVPADGLTREFFLCGPQGMMKAITDGLRSGGVKDNQVHQELFTAAGSGAAKAGTSGQAAGAAELEVVLDGNSHQVSMGPDKTILEAAQDAGIDAPFSCQGGVCSTCMAKVLEGEVKLDANFVLTDSELADGLIVTCQAHPVTDRVKLTYDI